MNTEKGGFEPPIPEGITVFETVAFDHSATSPLYNFQFSVIFNFKTWDVFETFLINIIKNKKDEMKHYNISLLILFSTFFSLAIQMKSDIKILTKKIDFI